MNNSKNYNQKRGKGPVRRGNRAGRRETTQVSRPLMGTSTMVKNAQSFELDYGDVSAVASATGALATWTVVLNGMYDPDSSLGGHQPLGFDQLMPFFNNYAVERCDFDVQIRQDSTAATAVMVRIADDAISVDPRYPEYPNSWATILSGSTAIPVWRVRGSWTAKEFERSRATQRANLQGTAAANPTDVWNLMVTARSDDASASFKIQVMVRLRFSGYFLGRKTVAQS